MKRAQVIRTVQKAAKMAGLSFEIVELKNHTGLVVDGHRATLGRHREIDEVTVKSYFKQFEAVLGKGWWK